MRLAVTALARQQIEEIRDWLLSSIGLTTAEHFIDTYEKTLRVFFLSDVSDLTRNLNRSESASERLRHPVYVLTFTTAQKRTRRSASGVYRLFYDVNIIEENMVRVLGVWHGAAVPIWETEEPEEK